MTPRHPPAFPVLAATLLLAAAPAGAAESFDNCSGFIDTLPATISTQGTWCLDGDLATAIASGNAITVSTNNVTIDCNDFKLGGLAAGPATAAYGIYALGRLNVVVRNCSIRGFQQGVLLDGGGHLVEDNRLDGNTVVGIQASGDGTMIRRNRVTDTGGAPDGGAAYGILATGSTDILDNTVAGVSSALAGTGQAFGIRTVNNFAGQVAGNRVRDLSGEGGQYGIYNLSSGRITLRGNDVVMPAGGGTMGIRCNVANGRAVGNIVLGFISPLQNCSDDGQNVLVP